jgi:hypothetical protein
MAKSNLFSVGVDTLLEAVRPYGRATTAFPPTLDEANARKHPGESLHNWFIRIVDEQCSGDPKRTALEDNIAVFVKLAWQGKKRLTYANVQTLVASCDLEEYYLDSGEANYFRLDFDYTTLGDPFSHPLAHIHIEGDLSPRFALEGGISGNIVVDYLEFLYRNYVPGRWITWAEREWQKEFVQTSKPDEPNPFATILEAFATSQFHILREHATVLSRIKRLLRKRKDELFAYHMEGADREILEYPSAR